MKSIAVITCWYGEYPWYFPYFIHSCAFNPSIDFYIITDNLETILRKPDNVIIVLKTLEELKLDASEKLGFQVNIDYPYKLCDFKPAYGFLFPEIIEEYDFWGQSDLDIIYGNIRDFITIDMLDKYDFISVRHDYTTGCFALYKNNPIMNTFFMKSKDYMKVLSNSKHYCFDECNFAWDELTSGKSIFDLDTEIESFTHIIKKAELKNEIKVHFDFILLEGLTGRITFDNGRIYYKNQFEGIMYHLFWFKKIYNVNKKVLKVPDKYYISKTKIYHSR
ncbi:hypothetical protein J0383_09545 [Flavobacterium endoglycinae]|uniref:Uncharacterized protein n=1 Tax=Flavobacterium endoglycinae TaxID=2816357 RepID=A0ABX7QKZ7_9FLAO|nr:DUF6625 family protein [Flavobacterium endoglycinae]QSW91031.1 hypothetical protein J0383_09545 [Flavobacterium endoglycinae]